MLRRDMEKELIVQKEKEKEYMAKVLEVTVREKRYGKGKERYGKGKKRYDKGKERYGKVKERYGKGKERYGKEK